MRADEAWTEIGSNTTIRGQLSGSENLKVYGRIEGALALESDLIVGEGAALKADVVADTVEIAGVVLGNISARTHVVLRDSARVVGDIESPRLTVAQGAQMSGAVVVAARDGKARAFEPDTRRREASRGHESRVPRERPAAVSLIEPHRPDRIRASNTDRPTSLPESVVPGAAVPHANARRRRRVVVKKRR